MTDSNLPPQQPGAGQPYVPATPLSPAEDKQWASFAHFGGIAVLFWLGWLPALVIYLIFKDRGSLTRQESKESLNFQITVTGALVANAIIGSILTVVTFGIWYFIQLLIHAVIVIAAVVFSILAGVKVNNGGSYRYPLTLRLVK